MGSVFNLETLALELVDGIRGRYLCRRRSNPTGPVISWLAYDPIPRDNGTETPSWRYDTSLWRESINADAGAWPRTGRGRQCAMSRCLPTPLRRRPRGVGGACDGPPVPGGTSLPIDRGTYTNITVVQSTILSQSDAIIITDDLITTFDEFLAAYGIAANDSTYPFLAKQAVYRLDKRINPDGFTGLLRRPRAGAAWLL